jgi:hypothetical protein
MKSKAVPLSHFSANPLKSVSNEASTTEKKDNRSPYLRAILSGTNNTLIAGKLFSAVSSDREAALRYIRETRMLHKK